METKRSDINVSGMILRFLFKNPQQFSLHELWDELQEHGADVSKTTISKQLNWLEGSGFVTNNNGHWSLTQQYRDPGGFEFSPCEMVQALATLLAIDEKFSSNYPQIASTIFKGREISKKPQANLELSPVIEAKLILAAGCTASLPDTTTVLEQEELLPNRGTQLKVSCEHGDDLLDFLQAYSNKVTVVEPQWLAEWMEDLQRSLVLRQRSAA